MKRILLILLVLSTLFTSGCGNNANSDRIATPPGHEEFVAVIGTNLSDALEILGVSESDLTVDNIPTVYHTGKTAEFGGVVFDVCLGMYTEEIVNAVFYIRNYEDDISHFASDVLNVAKALEKDFNSETSFGGSDDVLTKNVPLGELEKAFSKHQGHQISDKFDITETAPKNVQAHMEFMMTTDLWKENFYLTEEIPVPAGYLCEFLASCIPENSGGAMYIKYYVHRRPGNYMTEITS